MKTAPLPKADAPEKRKRGAYSRLICLGCRERRIRCELPSDVEIPKPGEVSTTNTPCYRCKRLGLECKVRQTVLGRPGSEPSISTAAEGTTPSAKPEYVISRKRNDVASKEESNVVSHVVVELDYPTPPHVSPGETIWDGKPCPPLTTELVVRKKPNADQDHLTPPKHTLLMHMPQSPDATLIIYARSTIHTQKVENQWFRHLPAHVGHATCLDLSIKATVTACALARKMSYVTQKDCYQALALALSSLHVAMKQSHTGLDDTVLASTALIAPFDGILKDHGIPARLHIEGLAAILKGRPKNYPVSQLARDIVDFQISDTAITACIRGVPSPFETIPRGYYASLSYGTFVDHRSDLKALGSELFVKIPRLVGLIRALRVQAPFSVNRELLSDAERLCRELVTLQNEDAETYLLANGRYYTSEAYTPPAMPATPPPFEDSLYFAALEDYEALMYYWSNRLCVLRLEQHIHDFRVTANLQLEDSPPIDDEALYRSTIATSLVKNILLCSSYTSPLPLNRHVRLYAYASVLSWGALSDGFVQLNDLGLDEEVGIDAVRDILAEGASRSVKGATRLEDKDMDGAADLFVGGLPSGKIMELYSDAL